VTLTGRVSAFFLGWLGFSLLGFAATLFFLARSALHTQDDDRLDAMLDTLTAAAEVGPHGVEWEPAERDIPRSRDAPLWVVGTGSGAVLDRSGESAAWLVPGSPDQSGEVPGPGGRWRICRRTLTGPQQPAAPEGPVDSGVHHPSIEIVAALPTGPTDSAVRRLGAWLALAGGAAWLLAAVVGRRLCRGTLAPVAEMASTALRLGPDFPGERLCVRRSGDELEQLGQAFNGVLDRLEEAIQRQRRFTGDAAHQMRTPLAAIRGQAEVALRRDRDPSEYRSALRAVAEESRHLNGVIESLLFLARADSEAGPPPLEELDLGRWAGAQAEVWRARHRGIQITTSLAAGAIVRAHAELLAQLVENLVDNAAKYAGAAGPVRIGVRRERLVAELSVEDSGPGIDPADLPHLFDAFFRSPSAREAGIPGVGLGLAIARRAAQAMRAELAAEPGGPRGVRFVVRFVGESP
jgi:signal transduction histidine kinase